MRRSLRVLTTLLALLTLAAYVAESAVATAFCPPDTAAEQPGAAGGTGHAGHDAGHGSDAGSDSGQTSHCPLGMASGSSCVAASLPAAGATAGAVPLAAGDTFRTPTAGHDLTAGHPLFRPPRA